MKYDKIEKLGQGGFGNVYHVKDENGAEMALKTFDLHPSMVSITEIAKKRFIKEAIYQQQIGHPNIVEIYSIYQNEEPPFFTMELAESSMLKDMNDGTLDSSNYLKCIYDIMAGLEEMHKLGMYHRDLKPGNVLRFSYGYAISDFGLISLNKTGITTLTKTGMSKTSDLYTAPEITQDLKFASIQSDIFSLGCILHDFVGNSQRIPCNEISDSSKFGNLLQSATRMDPSRRFSSVASFREALNSITSTIEDAKTEVAEIVLETLNKPSTDFDENDVSKLSDFLSSGVVEDEKDIIMSSIKLNHIKEILKYPHLSTYIAKSYFNFVRNGNFPWDFCDTLKNRVTEFMEIGTVDILSEGIFALLYMGTKHNRWYVQRAAASYLKNDIDSTLLKRIEMEIIVDGSKFCSAFKHLLYSIDEKSKNFNSDFQEIYKKVCSK
ncbi:serine/threonine protein kinase [Mariniflexile ostreae]|uniref:Serine/threonine protein kinase n=2 Tax=Flavobacteriaceae TaxID=49546 RepID=A0ABV5FBU3_9FLAO|nr:serine/threonine-protein kinase [Psychroserpens luteus]